MIVLESTRVLGLVYWATGPAYPTWTAPLEAASPHSKILEILFFTTNHTKLTTTKTPPPTPPQQQQKSKSHRNQNRTEREIGCGLLAKSKALSRQRSRRPVGRRLWVEDRWVEGSSSGSKALGLWVIWALGSPAKSKIGLWVHGFVARRL